LSKEVRMKQIHSTMESLEERLGNVSKYIEDIRDEKIYDKVIENIQLANRELNCVRDILIETFSEVLTERQMEVIAGGNNDDQTDPSIEYFGAEWSSVFSKLFNTGLNIRILKQRQSAGFMDTFSMASILCEMKKVQRELELHEKFIRSKNKQPPKHQRELVKYRKAKTEDLRGKSSEASMQMSGRRKRKSVIETIQNILHLKI